MYFGSVRHIHHDACTPKNIAINFKVSYRVGPIGARRPDLGTRRPVEHDAAGAVVRAAVGGDRDDKRAEALAEIGLGV